MKTKSSIKRMCRECRIVRRRGRLFVVCTASKKHKQRQGFHTLATSSSSSSSSSSVAPAELKTSTEIIYNTFSNTSTKTSTTSKVSIRPEYISTTLGTLEFLKK